MNNPTSSFQRAQINNPNSNANPILFKSISKQINLDGRQCIKNTIADPIEHIQRFQSIKEIEPTQNQSFINQKKSLVTSNLNKAKYSQQKNDNCKIHVSSSCSPNSEKSGQNEHSYQQFQQCLLHNKAADLICLDDQQMICPSCALFGAHKGHNIDSQQNALKKLSNLYEKSSFYFEKLKDKGQTEFSKHIFQGFCKQKAIRKRNQMTEQVKKRFSEIVQNIKKTQKQCLQNIQNIYKVHLDSFKRIQLFDSKLTTEIQEWTKNIEVIRQITQGKFRIGNQNFKVCTRLLKQGIQFLKTGQYLYSKCLKQQSNIKQVVQQQVNRSNLSFLQGFEQSAKHCCSIVDISKVKILEFSGINRISKDNLSLRPEQVQTNNLHSMDKSQQYKLNCQKSFVFQTLSFHGSIQNELQAGFKQQDEEFLLPIEENVQPFKTVTLMNVNLMQSSINQFVSEHFTSLNTSKDSIIMPFHNLSSKQRIAKQSNQDKQNMCVQSYRKSLFTRKKTTQFSKQLLTDSKRFSLNSYTPKPLSNIGPLQQRSQAPLQRNLLRDRLNQCKDKSASRSRNKNSRNPSVSSSYSNMSQSSKKKKSIKVPQKFKKVIDDLQNDRVQVIDLSGAELEQTIMLNICQYIKRSRKLKVLKLIRNSISDDSFVSILKAIEGSGVVSLNLSQNQLSERCLIGLEQIDLGNLRNLTLSMNKINRRSIKSLIDAYEKKGVILTV